MLTHLHVKNLAIVEDAEVDFFDGLNILTGETGAGKSVIMGSVDIALGARVSSDVIRSGEEYAYVELVFEPEEDVREALRGLDVFPDEGRLVISRKITKGRSVSRINGETVTLSALRDISSLLIDVHGQNEHQSLLYPERRLEIIDRYGGDKVCAAKDEAGELYERYAALKKELDGMPVSEEERLRRISFMEFEKNEIESAAISEGEEERLEAEYRRLSNAERISEAVGGAYGLTGAGDPSASSLIGKALVMLRDAEKYDDRVRQYADALSDAEGIISELNADMSSYMDGDGFDAGRLGEVSDRLGFVRKMFARYGGSAEGMAEYYANLTKDLEELMLCEQKREGLERRISDIGAELEDACGRLTAARRRAADGLERDIGKALSDLNFTGAAFSITFKRKPAYARDGVDEIEFMISANPGEEAKPLAKAASGGELSRIMLAVKSVLSDADGIHTLVFDEIDAGISGRTAQKVSEKLARIAKARQVICITHLAQIASMADSHFLIEKDVCGDRTRTSMRLLDEEGSDEELARIIGGARITDAVRDSAREMKELARRWKQEN